MSELVHDETTPPQPAARRIRAAFLDAGNTLLHIDHAALAALLRAQGHAATEEQVRRAECRARAGLSRALGGTQSMENARAFLLYVRLALEELGLRLDDGALGDLLLLIASANRKENLWRRRDPHADEVLPRLKAAGLVVGVVSNSDGTVEAALERAGFRRHLDFVIDSTCVGVEKPDPAIFRLALARAGRGIEPDEAVHVGDIHAIDVVGARRAGLHAILLDPVGAHAAGFPDCFLARDLAGAADRILALARG